MLGSMDAGARSERRRADLEGWIGDSQRLQRRLWWVLPLGAAAVVVAALVAPGSAPMLVAVAALALFAVGRYITAAHIADWRSQLEATGREPRSGPDASHTG